MSRLIPSVAIALALSVALLAPATAPAGATASNVTLSAGTVTGGLDFATQAFGDPWDYSNAEDQPLVDGATMDDMTQASIAGGRLVLDTNGGGWVAPLVSWDDLGALAWGRDGATYPIDAGRYTRIAVHMRADTASSAEVMWFNCGVASQSCQGGTSFNTTTGWRTYDAPLVNTTGTPAAWQGKIKGLRLYPTSAAGHVEIDWIRLYAPGQTATVTFSDSTGSTATAIWDSDADSSNNTSGNSGWGRLSPSSSGSGTRTFHAGALPQATYRVAMVDDGQTTYAAAPLVIDAPPAPVVIDPDRTGGLDYATLAGNAWDFNDPGDVYRVGNASSAIANGLLYGTNAAPLRNDPHVVLSQYGSIDGSRFHRLTLRMGHEGGFGLANVDGQGMNSRIVWTVPSAPEVAQVSDDLVVYPGWHTSTLDLASSPPNAVQEPGTAGQAGWAGQQIQSFRIDPNEDTGARQWYIDDVRLSEDDTAYGGAFDIRFLDKAWQAGTTATLRADTNQSGCDGTLIAQNIAVTAGVNTVRWAPRPIPAGTYWVCLTLTDGRSSTSAYATGPLKMTSRLTPYGGGDPFGSLDQIARIPGGVRVSGWAIDPDVVDPIDVHVYVGSSGVSTRAALERADIGTAYPVYGSAHGFQVDLPAGGGSYDVCAYAINVGEGSTRLLRCQRINLSSTPFGSVDRLRQVPGGVRFDGWALDPDTASSIDVHTYAGRSGVSSNAGRVRNDIAAAFPGYGPNHGFSAVAPVTAGGMQDMCTYAINVGPGGLGVLGCRSLNVRVDPWGALDAVQRVQGGVRVSGWTIDPSTSNSLDVHVYVGGVGTAIRADRQRNDLLGPFPEWGSAHGYDRVFGAPAGPVQVCAYGINQGLGSHVLLGCRTV